MAYTVAWPIAPENKAIAGSLAPAEQLPKHIRILKILNCGTTKQLRHTTFSRHNSNRRCGLACAWELVTTTFVITVCTRNEGLHKKSRHSTTAHWRNLDTKATEAMVWIILAMEAYSQSHEETVHRSLRNGSQISWCDHYSHEAEAVHMKWRRRLLTRET